MPQKGQITKHVWSTVHKDTGYHRQKCLHCPVERWEFLPRNRYGERDIRYVGPFGTYSNTPKCITRKITDNEDKDQD